MDTSPIATGSSAAPTTPRSVDDLLREFRTLVIEILARAPGNTVDLFRIVSEVAFSRRFGPVRLETPPETRLERQLFPTSRTRSILGTPLRPSNSPTPSNWDDEDEDRDTPVPDINWSA